MEQYKDMNVQDVMAKTMLDKEAQNTESHNDTDIQNRVRSQGGFRSSGLNMAAINTANRVTSSTMNSYTSDNLMKQLTLKRLSSKQEEPTYERDKVFGCIPYINYRFKSSIENMLIQLNNEKLLTKVRQALNKTVTHHNFFQTMLFKF